MSSRANEGYNIHMDVKYKHLQLIDIPDIVAHTREKWSNQS